MLLSATKPTNPRLIQYLKSRGVLRSPEIEAALQKVPREKFVPADLQELAYTDQPLPIGENQTISQPTTVVLMLQLLQPQPGNQILEIGAGSGWQTALLAELVGPQGYVYAFEILAGVGELGKSNLARLEYQNITYAIADAAQHWADQAPYDRIIAGAAFATIPNDLEQQLRIGGRLVAPTQDHDVRLIERNGPDKFATTVFPGFAFVPITHQ